MARHTYRVIDSDLRGRSGIGDPRRVAYAAAAWASCNGALSIYWALGGQAGLDLLSDGITEQAAAGGEVVVLVWLSAALKVCAGLVALALIRPRRWSAQVRRLLVAAAWLGGGVLTLYGVVGILGGGLVMLGLVEAAGETPLTVRLAYLLLWSPLWVLGGLLFVETGRRARAWSTVMAGAEG